jgi:hypothetical protein
MGCHAGVKFALISQASLSLRCFNRSPAPKRLADCRRDRAVNNVIHFETRPGLLGKGTSWETGLAGKGSAMTANARHNVGQQIPGLD